MKKEKTAEQKKEVKSLVLTTLLAAVAMAAVVFVIVFYIQSKNATKTPTVIKAEVTDIKGITLSSKTLSVPYVVTDIDSVVYTADSAGNITFFEFNGTDYVQIDETGNINISVPLSNQQIPVTIHYIERNGVLTGYGVFTSDENSGVYIYDYMLCKITNLPAAYASENKCLLLANTDIKSVYSENPVWEEAYFLNMTSGAATRFFSENNRMLTINGAVRSDFCLVTAGELKSATAAIPFFSSRAYDVSDDAPVDIYIKSGSSETLAASDVADKYAKPTDDGGFVFIKEKNGGFSTVKYLNGQQSVITDFYSQYGVEYIRSGDWLLCKEDGRVYSTFDDTVIDTPDFKINPTQFAVSADGKYIVMAGTVANALDYQIYVYNTQTKKCNSYSDSDYSVHFNLYFSSNSTVCFYTLTAAGFNTTVIDISKV